MHGTTNLKFKTTPLLIYEESSEKFQNKTAARICGTTSGKNHISVATAVTSLLLYGQQYFSHLPIITGWPCRKTLFNCRIAP
jgi:hypothetical protein